MGPTTLYLDTIPPSPPAKKGHKPKRRLTCGARGAGPARRTLTLKPQGGLFAAASVVAGIREAGVFRCGHQHSSQQGAPTERGYLTLPPATKSHARATSSSSFQEVKAGVGRNPAVSGVERKSSLLLSSPAPFLQAFDLGAGSLPCTRRPRCNQQLPNHLSNWTEVSKTHGTAGRTGLNVGGYFHLFTSP